MATADFFKLLTLGFTIVLIGVLVKNAGNVNTIMSGFASSYGSVLGQLQKSGS